MEERGRRLERYNRRRSQLGLAGIKDGKRGPQAKKVEKDKETDFSLESPGSSQVCDFPTHAMTDLTLTSEYSFVYVLLANKYSKTDIPTFLGCFNG